MHMSEPEDIVITHGKHLCITQDTLNLRSLLAIVEASVSLWQQRLQTAQDVDRDRAAAAIKDLSRILDSLSQQLVQGRETVRITTRLPSQRRYTVVCPACGHGNRESARFCQWCGSALPEAKAGQKRVEGPPMLRLVTAMQSDTGQVRDHNEDTCLIDTFPAPSYGAATLLLVADGMGGSQAGEHASRVASEAAQHAIMELVRSHQPTTDEDWQTVLQQAVQTANREVYEQANAHQHLAGMGTTLTLAVVVAMRAHIAHVGDSRAYLLNAQGVAEDGATVLQVTSDHSLVARLVDIGQLTPQAARVHPQRNIIYRSLGGHATIDVDTSSQSLEVGDVLLLCSDGLTAHLEDAELAQVVLESQLPDQVCQLLVTRANQRGGKDNISVVLAVAAGIDHAHL